jgi:diguanylate cyclase (GGDEF)-like protein
LPDVGAVALLTCAFASVARRGQTRVSGLWLIGWLMIVLHFSAFTFLSVGGILGDVAAFVGLSALVWAGILFMWAAVPFRDEPSSRWMVAVFLATGTLYLGVLVFTPDVSWALALAALFFGVLPVIVALVNIRRSNHPLRWVGVVLYVLLSIFLLLFQQRPQNGAELAINAVFCTVYLGCAIFSWHTYRRATAGAFITISGFFAWAGVFVVAPAIGAFFPYVHLESEVWNLPKYLVAVGMILLLLEDQIEHNKYLALHDELTGLPNRRLFQDRLASALERARRLGSQSALLLVDLDHFKQVNDTFGHHTGDLVLERVGEILSARVRRSDTVARTGGDEFSIVLEEPTSYEEAEIVCHSLAELLAEPLEVGSHTVTIGASVGLAIFPDDAATMESLCIAADRRMYSKKSSSKIKEDGSRPPMPVRLSPAGTRSGMLASE